MTNSKLISFIFSLVTMFFIAVTNVHALASNEVLAAANAARSNAGVGMFQINGKLQRAAEMKLADIQQYRYWSHNNPTTGATWTTFIRKAGYSGQIGENLASNYGSADAVISAWFNSPSHRANLLNKSYREIGVAIGSVDFGQGNETVVVATFGAGSRLQAKR